MHLASRENTKHSRLNILRYEETDRFLLTKHARA